MPRTPSEKRVIHGPGYTLEPARAPLVMGILNVTPDSFSDGGRHHAVDAAIRRALDMAAEGAHIIDVGGESTRPGADPVAVEEELARVIPVIRRLAPRLGVPISIDTRRAVVASAAIEAGAGMVNDVAGGADPEMFGVVRAAGVPMVVMHMKGEPRSMQANPTYDDVVAEVRSFLEARAEAMTRAGIGADKIVIDPGIGFGKRFQDNLELLAALSELRATGYATLIGASRKAFLGTLLDAPPGERLAGSLAVAAVCYRAGVEIIRVHDVRETVGLFRVLDAIEHPNEAKANP